MEHVTPQPTGEELPEVRCQGRDAVNPQDETQWEPDVLRELLELGPEEELNFLKQGGKCYRNVEGSWKPELPPNPSGVFKGVVRTRAPLAAAPDTTRAPLAAAPDTTRAPLAAAPDTTRAPLAAAPDTTRAPLAAAPDTTRAPLAATPDTTENRVSGRITGAGNGESPESQGPGSTRPSGAKETTIHNRSRGPYSLGCLVTQDKLFSDAMSQKDAQKIRRQIGIFMLTSVLAKTDEASSRTSYRQQNESPVVKKHVYDLLPRLFPELAKVSKKGGGSLTLLNGEGTSMMDAIEEHSRDCLYSL